MARPRSRVRGAKTFRRILRGMPDAMRNELAGEMQQGGAELLAAMRSRAPRGATGKLASGLTAKVYPRYLRLRVGYIGKRVNSRLFYARILEFGRRAQTVSVSRLNKGGRQAWRSRIRARQARLSRKPHDLVSVYQLRVKPLAPRRFVYGPLTNLRVVFGRRLRGAWDRALKSIAGANGND